MKSVRQRKSSPLVFKWALNYWGHDFGARILEWLLKYLDHNRALLILNELPEYLDKIKIQSTLESHRKNHFRFWLQYYYGTWDLEKIELVLHPHQKLRSWHTTTTKHETLKISIGNRLPANSVLFFFPLLYNEWCMGIWKAFDKNDVPPKMRVP